MPCEGCKGSGRMPNGFFTLECGTCRGTGKLTVDDIWKMRDGWAYAKNQLRLFEWKRKYNV